MSTIPQHSNPVQWQQSVGLARQVCARVFRDGGAPADAMRALGLTHVEITNDWAKAVDRIAAALCSTPLRKAA